MPEGDTIFRTAQTLQRVLGGDVVTRFESVFPALTRIDHDRPLAGRTVESVSARGKHLLIAFSGDLFLHTHMRMNGSWHVYRPGERWRRPAGDMRIVVSTDRASAVGFNIPVAEFLTGRDLLRHPQLRALGPDPLLPSFDRAEALRRMRAREHEQVGDVLLDQRVVAGIGNVFKSEILFAARVNPFDEVGRLSASQLERVLEVAVLQLRANVRPRSEVLTPRMSRRTTGSMHPDGALWVYDRRGQPCRICGAAIQSVRTGPYARRTFWCARCQAPAGVPVDGGDGSSECRTASGRVLTIVKST